MIIKIKNNAGYRYQGFYYLSRVILLYFYTVSVSAAGIAIMEHSVKELGQAFSGAPTNIEDGSMVFFNPGAMNQINGRLVSVAGYVAIPSATFENHASQLNLPSADLPLQGGNGGDSPQTVLIPNFYYVQSLTERIAVGLGVNVPFGMQSSYHPNWKGRYQAIDSRLAVINFNPAVSVKIMKGLSIGAGFDVQYLHSRLTAAIDFGTICLQALGPPSCANQGLLPQAADGLISLKGHSVGFGYNIGIFYAPNQNIRLGVSYRSEVHHNVHSDADFTIPDQANALTRNNTFVNTRAHSSVTMPDNVLFGFYHRLNSKWAISADAMWTRWSHIRELRAQFSSAQPDDILNLQWKDTWRYAFGISYSPVSHKLTLRTGFAYDESPVPDSHHRSPRIPDNDRFWLTAGASYAVVKNIALHIAYAHLFIDDAAIDKRGATGDQLVGKFTEHINIVGLQLDWRF